MPKGLILLGPSGSGKTTLGKLVAGRLGIAFLDIDDYIWRKDTAIPYTVMYTKAEKIRRLMDAVEKAGEFVMAGSMNSFHECFDPFFLLAVYLTAEEKLRVSRILPGGDMFEAHQAFLMDSAAYDHGAASCSSRQHELWLSQLTCPVLRLDGGEDPEKNAERIIAAYEKAQVR